MEADEIRLRCIEAAVKTPQPGHAEGAVAAVLEAAEKYFGFVVPRVTVDERATLGLPKKK